MASIAERAGAAIASALGGVESFEECVVQMSRRGPERVSPFSIVQTLPNLAAGWVSIELEREGRCWRSALPVPRRIWRLVTGWTRSDSAARM